MGPYEMTKWRRYKLIDVIVDVSSSLQLIHITYGYGIKQVVILITQNLFQSDSGAQIFTYIDFLYKTNKKS